MCLSVIAVVHIIIYLQGILSGYRFLSALYSSVAVTKESFSVLESNKSRICVIKVCRDIIKQVAGALKYLILASYLKLLFKS